MQPGVLPHNERWRESRAYLKISRESWREGLFSDALEAVHAAHDLGRDHVLLHACAHLHYVAFSFREADYRRALGHVFWAVTSPIMVPIDRRKRSTIIRNWAPAKKSLG